MENTMEISMAELRTLILNSNGQLAAADFSASVTAPIGRYVVVRTVNAGVHVGVLEEHDGRQTARLSATRRIWSWKGRNTLSEITLRGVGTGSRVSEVNDERILTDVIEIAPCTAEAEQNLREVATWTN